MIPVMVCTGWKIAPEALREIRNRDPISRAEQDDHGLADDTAQPEQNRGDDARQRRGDEDARDGLQPIRAERVGCFLETARDIAQRIF